ncbi:hypothetical protein P3W24_06360 [Luteibacter sp. PPL201]|uniref:FeoB-associated Cys-rich membrane protein n=1 Tax=Luteibacter sahnii TaxID=3021977 RepID=A0ABT6B8Z2_9GAMM|nr:DUF6587 family protein [Luteibacter sp. PPL193]MDY1549495.1 hypothetical protein [Luteibacter sp. PPL193]
MTPFDIVQGVVVGVVVLASAYVAFRKLLPKTSTRTLAAISASLNRDGRSAWLRRMGRRLQPTAATGSCGDGCGSCNSCGPAPVARGDAQPLTFKSRR